MATTKPNTLPCAWQAILSPIAPLMAVISEQGINLQSMRVVRVLGKGPSTVRRSLEALMGRDILREEEQQGRVRMRFEDPFFAQWIRKFTNL
jgi:hypothetical protein